VLRFYGMMAMGLNTRTNERPIDLRQGLRPMRIGALAGSDVQRMRLGGRTNLAIWPGAVRHVQRETLKARRPVSFAGVQLPAAWSVHRATALNSHTNETTDDNFNSNSDGIAPRLDA
jgi:hypothetical protein